MPRDANPYGGQGVTTIDAKVTGVDPFDCNSGGEGPDGLPQVKGDCAHITASIDDGTATFDLDAARYKAGIKAGDEVKVLRIAPKGQEVSYEFLDFRAACPSRRSQRSSRCWSWWSLAGAACSRWSASR